MKKLLTILILLLTTISIHAEKVTTLWESTYTGEIELNSGTVATFKAGDKLRVYGTVPEGGANFKICFKGASNSWAETAIPSINNQWPWINYNPGFFEATFTEEDITALSGMNIYIAKGDYSTITKVSLVSTIYTVTINDATGGTYTVNNGTKDLTSGETITDGTQLTLTPTPNAGFSFTKWTINGEDVTTNPYNFTPTGDVTISATFTDNRSERVLTSTGGTVGDWSGDVITFPAARFANAAVGDRIVVTISALPDADYHQIALQNANGGNGETFGGNHTASVGDNVFTLTDAMLTELKSNGLKITGYQYTYSKVALWSESALGTVNYTVTINDATGGTYTVNDGNANLNNGATIPEGTSLTLTPSASSGYSFTKWTINEEDVTTNPYNFTPTGDVTISATFTDNRSERVLTSTGGTVGDWSGDVITFPAARFANAAVGDRIVVTISALPDAGYHQISFQNASGSNGDTFGGTQTASVGDNVLTLTDAMLTELKSNGLKITGYQYTYSKVALWSESALGTVNYTVTINDATGGTYTVNDGNANLSSGATIPEGTSLTLTPSASSGYSFTKWTINGADVTTSSYTFTPTGDVTISATFAANPLANEDRRTLWEGAGQALSWTDLFVQTAGVGSIVEAGEILIVTASTVDTSDKHYPKISLRDTNSNEIGKIDPLVAGENRLSITSSMATAMAGGFKFQGESATITKIELYKPTPITALAEEETKTLWSNTSGTALSWNTVAIDRAAEWGAVLEEDERIIISVKAKETGENVWPTVQLQNDTEKIASTANLLNDLTVPCDITITLTAEMVNKMKNGFSITGNKATITKAVLYKPTMPTKTVHTLNSTETAISGDTNVTVAAAKFANISAYDVLTVNFTITTSPANVILKGNGEDGGWDYLKEMKFENGETLFALPLTPAMTSNIKKNGLQITGSGYTFKSVTIKTAGEVPSDSDDSGDDSGDEETVIDEETGEADLTELSAQDDTKTTLTQNEDGSITMTTTEAYCAAQIWFSDPEPVAGNVLKVELAESSVNVTVTVKYTDGTESQMSANTMVAKARGETRSASGTTVEVPLESGKEVQNIEVKNNVAGTITIKKMQVTTVNVFTNGVANLSMLKPQSNATYDTAAHTLATTKGWTGATISPVANENVSGKELLIEFADASKVKVAVKYRTDVEGPSTIMEKAAKAVRLALDNTKNIQEISIQPTEAAIVTFTKIAVNSEETDDGSLKPGKTITLWENAAGETLAWNEVAKQDASVGETLKEYDELLITVSGVTKDCDWPKVFIRDASSEQAGNEVLLNDIASFPYTVRIVLTGEMAQQLQKGFSICGDGVTVTKLQVYRPEAPKPGDIHLADLNYGYNSSYDKGTHTITTTARWAARGWEIGDKRYNDKNLITVKFEAVDFPVTLKMEYTTGLQTAQATSVGVPAGRTELLLEIPSGISKLNRVYIIYENPGSVKLTEASVTYQDNLKLSTAIRSFEADGVIRDGRYDTDGWYNLRGMRIPEPKTSGVYIHGGKKVVIY